MLRSNSALTFNDLPDLGYYFKEKSSERNSSNHVWHIRPVTTFSLNTSHKKIVGRGQKCRPSKKPSPLYVTPSLQQWRSPSTFRGAPGEDPLKWLKEYDRVANFNKWDDMMCLANVYFFLDGTARQWYVNNEDALDSWEAFKNGLSGLFGDRQRYTRRAEEQLKCRAQRSGEEYTVLHTKCIRTLPRGKSSDERRRKSVTPNERCC
ncbi:retrotrans_gag domain-containing protein [Trichonephila clavipes]|nr:retrotrans_gag domain-containing protein [Trichonephila clavipes]